MSSPPTRSPLRNLELCIERCHLAVEALVATPYASGLSALVDDEAELGGACIDFGGGTTTLSVFADGQFVHADAIAARRQHITTDIARGLSTPLDDAERLKTLHGSAFATLSDEREIITDPAARRRRARAAEPDRQGAARPHHPAAHRGDSRPDARPAGCVAGFAAEVAPARRADRRRSQLTGLPELARRMLGRHVRLGRPLGIGGLPEVAKGPAFAAAVGPADLSAGRATSSSPRRGEQRFAATTGTGGYFARVGEWIRDNF